MSELIPIMYIAATGLVLGLAIFLLLVWKFRGGHRESPDEMTVPDIHLSLQP